MCRFAVALVVLVVLLPAPLFAQTKSAPAASPAAPAATLNQLSSALRTFLLANIPATLYSKSRNWDRQEISPKLKGLRVVHVPRNDGTWRKIKVTPDNPARTLEVKVSDLKNRGKDKMTFKTFVALGTRVEMEEQIWESGHRLYSGSMRARLRIKLDLDVENTIKLDYKGGILPDVVFRLKIIAAKVSYDNLVVEHIAGVGGSAARLTGEAIRSALKKWKPSVERDLLAKASATLLKAGDTKEIRLGLGSLTK
jgi:hypothetical protein